MKRCPTCQKTFDDAMRFCQTDGTPLVEDQTPADPYKTMVASKEDIASALNAPASAESMPSGIGTPENEPLELPSEPVGGTSASEMETKLAGRDDAQVIEIPPLAESAPPEPPKFNEPSTPPPSFGEQGAPPSPFSAPEPGGPGDFPTTPPIPSPFGGSRPSGFEPPPTNISEPEPEPEEPTYFEPEPAAPARPEPEPPASTPPFAEPEHAAAQQFSPFEQQSSSPGSGAVAQTEWTPPPAQGGPGMQQPPSMTGTKLNQTLPIVSLVAGILGLTLCCGTLIPSVVAIITGFMGRGKATKQPHIYGGAGLALGGIITGIIGLLGGLLLLLMYLPFVIAMITNIIANS